MKFTFKHFQELYPNEDACLDKLFQLRYAHVKKVGSTDTTAYIIPLCSLHNKSTEEIEISDSYKLVSANKKETCDK